MAADINADNRFPYEVRTDIRPGDIGSIIYLHGVLYAREYGFDHTFEPYVAEPIARFVLENTAKDRLWIVEKQQRVRGSVAIVKHSDSQAQLRWLILHPELRGIGLGRLLVTEAVNFAAGCGYESIFLWTLDILPAALKIYQSAGFRLTETKTHQIWGRNLTEERYELKLMP